MKHIKTLTAAILLASSFQAAAEIKALNSIAMEVNASIITYGDIERAVRVLRASPTNKDIPNSQLAAAARQQLMERALMVEAAKNAGLKATEAEIDAEIQRRALLAKTTPDALYAQAKSFGLSKKSYRLEVAKDLLSERVMMNVIEDVQVEDGKVLNYIQQAQKEGKTLPAGSPYTVYQVRRILMNINDTHTSKAVGDRIKLLAQAVQQGQDFATLAKRYSQEAAAVNGGLQELSEGLVPAKVEAMMRIVPNGQISAPIQTAKNWQMLYMVSQRTENNPTKMQEHAVRLLLLKQEQQKAQGQFLGSLQHGTVVRQF